MRPTPWSQRSVRSSPPTGGWPNRCARASSPRRSRSSPAGAPRRAAEEFYVRTFAEPALDINGIESGSPNLQKTVLPVQATANVSIRLAPVQDAAEIASAFERLVREAAPPGAELDVVLLSS